MVTIFRHQLGIGVPKILPHRRMANWTKIYSESLGIELDGAYALESDDAEGALPEPSDENRNLISGL